MKEEKSSNLGSTSWYVESLKFLMLLEFCFIWYNIIRTPINATRKLFEDSLTVLTKIKSKFYCPKILNSEMKWSNKQHLVQNSEIQQHFSHRHHSPKQPIISKMLFDSVQTIIDYYYYLELNSLIAPLISYPRNINTHAEIKFRKQRVLNSIKPELFFFFVFFCFFIFRFPERNGRERGEREREYLLLFSNLIS